MKFQNTSNPCFMTKWTILQVLLVGMLVISCGSLHEGKSIATDDLREAISLHGQWALHLDPDSTSSASDPRNLDYNMQINLPGTLDDAGIGEPNEVEVELKREVMLYLHRKVTYTGPAYYTREVHIPENWDGKQVVLKLERVIWESTVWINGARVGNEYSLSTPHYYDLTEYLEPGENSIVIRIDNAEKFNINRGQMAHAYTNHTQIKWNGILGEISLTAVEENHISKLDIYSEYTENRVDGTVTLHQAGGRPVGSRIRIFDPEKETIATLDTVLTETVTEFSVSLNGELTPWNEFSPSLYEMEVTLSDESGNFLDRRTDTFGFRDLRASGTELLVNDAPIFLRGTLECAIFPLTGYPPTDASEWEEIFKTAKEFGLNHIRFHSWCPPKAAFDAADRMGIYLQVELPNWSLNFGHDRETLEFFHSEADRILSEYGNHPSFAFMSLGNELQGDFEKMTELVAKMKQQDQRRLYTTTSFTFQFGRRLLPMDVDDFFITQYTQDGWVRGQGVFDEEYPNFNSDYSHATGLLNVPLITHEIGQYSVYPDMSEIDKYTGVLQPLNFLAVKKDLQEKGMYDLAPEFTNATGKFATILYKEEIERALKTDGVSGFQLLDLRDFPGQGTALVGVLNAFWEPKSFVTGDEWRRFTSEVVPLLWFDKAVYTSDEQFTAEYGVSNFFELIADAELYWQVLDENQQVMQTGKKQPAGIASGQTRKIGEFGFPLSDLPAPAKYTIELGISGTDYRNSWNFWLYEENLTMPNTDIIVTGDLQEALQALQTGKKVLLSPDIDQIEGIEGKFVPVFWSPVHFPNQPGTMGLLVEPEHPAFGSFPTDFHSDWQWWDLSKNSKTLPIDDLNVEPVIRVIDNFFRNRMLSNVFQTRVGDGHLVFSAIDLHSELDHRPVARQLKYSLLNYMGSEQFLPTGEITKEELTTIFTKKPLDQ